MPSFLPERMRQGAVYRAENRSRAGQGAAYRGQAEGTASQVRRLRPGQAAGRRARLDTTRNTNGANRISMLRALDRRKTCGFRGADSETLCA